MGIGDELMMAGEARRRAERAPGTRYLVLDKAGAPKWHFTWEGNPHIAHPGEAYAGVVGFRNGLRPYMESKTAQRYVFRRYDPVPAVLAVPPASRALSAQAQGAILFNPTVKMKAPPNKQWGLARWKALCGQGAGYRWLQIGEPGYAPRIGGAQRVATSSFWDACGLIMGARAVVCHEGALHHAAAALGVPCVVIRGGFISPRVTGYAGQADLYIESEAYPLGCGMRHGCRHCTAAMVAITPDAVLQALHTLLAGT